MKHPRVLIAFATVLAIAGTGTAVFAYTHRSTESAGQTQQMATAQTEVQKAVATNSVSIQNYTFSPQTITVKKGKTVIWSNNDSVTHTIIFDDPSISASGSLNQGAGFSLAFDHSGTFTYHSAAYPDATGTVIVTD